MGTMSRRFCDICHTDQDVDECTIVYSYGRRRPWAVDLCPACYEAKMGDLIKKSHPVKRSNVRPQGTIEETILRPEQLAGRPIEHKP